MFTNTDYMQNIPDFDIGATMGESSLSSLPFSFDRRHYKKDSRFVNDLYTLTYDDHESLDSVRLFSSFANQVSRFSRFVGVVHVFGVNKCEINWME